MGWIDPSWAVWQVVVMLAMVPVLLAIAIGATWFCISTFNETWRDR